MPEPRIGEVNGAGEVWTGARWARPPGTPFSPTAGAADTPLGLALGPRQERGPWDATDTKTMNELLKQFFTIGGATVGGLAAGVPGAIAGGGLGRMVGGAGEQTQELASGRGFSPTAIINEAPAGAMEGATQELLPAALHSTLRLAGRAGRFFGPRLSKNPITGMTGVPLEVGGELADIAAEKLGPGTTSERLRRRLFTPEAPTPPTTRARLDAGADRYARTKRATALQDAAREGASGLPADLADEGVTVRTRTVRPQAEPSEFGPYREPPPPDTGGGGAGGGPPQPDPRLENLRQRTGTSFTPRWSAREGRWVPMEAPPPAAAAEVPFTFEGAPGGTFNDYPPGPSVNPGGRNQFAPTSPRITRPTVDPNAAVPDFTFEGSANPRAQEWMAPGQTIESGGGSQFTMPKNIKTDVPVSKSTAALRTKTGTAKPSKVQVLSEADAAQLPPTGSTGSPVADVAAARVGKNAPARQGKVTYNGGDVQYTIDYDNPHPVTGVFPAVRIRNGEVDPFTNWMPDYQIPFLEDIDRMHRARTGSTIDVTPTNALTKKLK